MRSNKFILKIIALSSMLLSALSVHALYVFIPPVINSGSYTNESVNPFVKSSKGQCTWYVFGRVNEAQNTDLKFTANSGRDAHKWAKLLAPEYQRLSSPVPGAIAIWKHRHIANYGHVAYVEHVNGNAIMYTEANFSNIGKYDGKLKHEDKKTFENNKGLNNAWSFIGYVLPSHVVPSRQGVGANTVTSGAVMPSQAAVKRLVTDYYNTQGEWAGTFTLGSVDRLRLQKINDAKIIAHVRYRYVPVLGNYRGRTDTGYDQRTFQLVNHGNGWQAASMGGYMSASP